MINIFEPQLGQEELKAVKQVFDSKWIGKGKKTEEFEQAFADHLGVEPEDLVSTNSCTEGLFQVVKSLCVRAESVIIPSISFIGSLQAVLNAKAIPVFCDIDRHTLNTTPEMIWDKISNKVKVIIPLHYGGMPCELDEFIFSKFWVVEDAACAHCSRIDGQSCGANGDFGVWSFDAMKLMTCGDGGMIYCPNSSELRQRVNLGLSNSSGLESDNDNWWEFEIETTGNRSITNDIASAIGLEQLKKLPQFIAIRKQIWELYNELLADLPIRLPPEIPANVQSSYYFYWIQLDNRDELARYLRANDVYTTFKYWPLHLAYKTGDSLPNAEWAAEHTLNLPLHPGLTDSDVGRICELIKGWILK